MSDRNGAGADAGHLLQGLDDELAGLVEPLKLRYSAASEQRDALMAQVAEIDRELRKMDRVLRILAPDDHAPPHGKPGPKGQAGVSSTIRNYKVSDATLRGL